MSGITTARDAMKMMPEQDRAKILEQVEVFKVEKRKFDIEVSKWDDNGNDIIVLAKHMVRFFSCRFQRFQLFVPIGILLFQCIRSFRFG